MAHRAVWYLIVGVVLGPKPLSEKVSRMAFLLYILFLQLASAHHILVDPGISSEWKIFNTSYAMYLAVLGSMIHGMSVPGAIEAAQRRWLERQLAGAGGKRIFLATHYPPFLVHPEEPPSYDNMALPAGLRTALPGRSRMMKSAAICQLPASASMGTAERLGADPKMGVGQYSPLRSGMRPENQRRP